MLGADGSILSIDKDMNVIIIFAIHLRKIINSLVELETRIQKNKKSAIKKCIVLREIEFSQSGASGGEPLFFSQNKKFKKRSSRRHTIFFSGAKIGI